MLVKVVTTRTAAQRRGGRHWRRCQSTQQSFSGVRMAKASKLCVEIGSCRGAAAVAGGGENFLVCIKQCGAHTAQTDLGPRRESEECSAPRAPLDHLAGAVELAQSQPPPPSTRARRSLRRHAAAAPHARIGRSRRRCGKQCRDERSRACGHGAALAPPAGHTTHTLTPFICAHPA